MRYAEGIDVASEHNVIAFEMEGAGVRNIFTMIVIRMVRNESRHRHLSQTNVEPGMRKARLGCEH